MIGEAQRKNEELGTVIIDNSLRAFCCKGIKKIIEAARWACEIKRLTTICLKVMNIIAC